MFHLFFLFGAATQKYITDTSHRILALSVSSALLYGLREILLQYPGAQVAAWKTWAGTSKSPR